MLNGETGDTNGKKNGLNRYAIGEEGIKYGWLSFSPPKSKMLLNPLMCRIVLTICVSYAGKLPIYLRIVDDMEL